MNDFMLIMENLVVPVSFRSYRDMIASHTLS
jgi:hypothetical protein